LRPATAARSEPAADRLLVVAGDIADRRVDDLKHLLRAGDLLVVNDAATLPASLRGQDPYGAAVELRLLGAPAGDTWPALLFGSGDWRTQTEDRPRPPAVAPGDVLRFAAGLAATVTRVWPESPRLLDIRFDRSGASLLAALYAHGRPVQYAYLPEPLSLRTFQTPFAARPWAAEMPSAGRVLSAARLAALRRAGVEVAGLTHAAGLSSTGEPALDALLPLPEPYDVPAATARAVGAARARGGRVIAAGTTVVRALEAASTGGSVVPGLGVARLRIDRTHALRSVDAILTGMHEPGSSHFDLLAAFAPPEVLTQAHARAEAEGYLAHEFGDSMLVWAPDKPDR
jgi:S-adenosylmethionine:tRNA ribosyltransferase-isomerase